MADAQIGFSMHEPLALVRDGDVVTIWLNRPKTLNAIDLEMAQELHRAARTIADDSSVRAVVLRGVGKGFCAGGDLSAFRGEGAATAASAMLDALTGAVHVLSKIDAPVIASVHGVAAGAGMSLMLHADFVVAAHGTRFALAYDKIGANCDAGASWMLPRLVGLRRAFEIAMLGNRLDSDTAQTLGLVNRCVPADDLDEEVMALARRLAEGPTRALGHMRRLLRAGFNSSLSEQMALETTAFVEGVGTLDFQAGIDAFFTKTTPVFTGR